LERRDFLKNSSTAIFSTLMPSTLLRKKNKIGLNLFLLQALMKTSTAKTLADVAKVGYKDVESVGYSNGLFYGEKPAILRRFLINEGLTMNSGHIQLGSDYSDEKGTIYNDWERAIADAATVGQSYMVLGWIAPEFRRNLNDYKKLAHQLNKCGEECQKYGIKLLYHNHDFEFTTMETLMPYNVLMRYTEADFVGFELDTYWASKADVKLSAIIEANKDRFPIIQLADMSKTPDKECIELGKGSLDVKNVLALLDMAGTKRIYLGQNISENPLASIETNLKYLRQIKY
jgi:sugar phosphate isomerase/epimerase